VDLNLTRLRYFATVARLGNFRRAAEILHVAQPALSRHVQLLEEDMGVQLLARTARGVTLTEAGKVLMEGSENLVRLSTVLRDEVRARTSVPRGTVRIGALPSIAQKLVPGAIAQVRARYPEIRFTLTHGYTEDLREMLLADKLDVALLTEFTRHPDLLAQPLYREDIWLVSLPGRPSRRRMLKAADLAGVPLMVPQYLRMELERVLPAAELNIVVELEASVPMAELVATGVVSYFGPPLAMWDDISAGRLAGVPVQGFSLTRALARHKNRPPTTATLILAETLMRFATEGGFSKGLPFVHPA
jgi:LysR family nitrogen assimilation transcriptional regulator